MKLKRISALLLAVLMVFALVACSNNGGSKTETKKPDSGNTPATQAGTTDETYELKIKLWVPDAAVELTKKQIDDFNNSNEFGIKFNATIEAVG